MGFEAVQFDEGARVEQQLGPLAGREFPMFMLLLDSIWAAPRGELLHCDALVPVNFPATP